MSINIALIAKKIKKYLFKHTISDNNCSSFTDVESDFVSPTSTLVVLYFLDINWSYKQSSDFSMAAFTHA